jgi:S1-C subfamily serine protease
MMIKLVGTLVLSVVLGMHTTSGFAQNAPASDAAPADDARTLYLKKALNVTVLPELSGLRQQSLGTGFLVAPDVLLTNSHVINLCSKVSVQIGGAGGEVVLGQPLANDPGRDLALLRIARLSASYALIESNFARVDPTELFVVGFPSLGLPTVRPILVTAKAQLADLATTKPRLSFHADVRHGNSGSPLFDNFGAVVGIVTMAIDTPKVYTRTGVLVTEVGVAIS